MGRAEASSIPVSFAARGRAENLQTLTKSEIAGKCFKHPAIPAIFRTFFFTILPFGVPTGGGMLFMFAIALRCAFIF